MWRCKRWLVFLSNGLTPFGYIGWYCLVLIFIIVRFFYINKHFYTFVKNVGIKKVLLVYFHKHETKKKKKTRKTIIIIISVCCLPYSFWEPTWPHLWGFYFSVFFPTSYSIFLFTSDSSHWRFVLWPVREVQTLLLALGFGLWVLNNNCVSHCHKKKCEGLSKKVNR